MSKRIFKYEGNGSESENQSLAEFLKEAKGAENPFNYIVEASEQSAAGIVGRVNSGDPNSLLPGDQALFDQWSGDFDQCGSCPCEGMSDATCAMFAARNEAPDDDNCTEEVDCRGVCGGLAELDLDDSCCMEADISQWDGLCYGCEDCSCACPNQMYSFSSNAYNGKAACYKESEEGCANGCVGAYGSLEECENTHDVDPENAGLDLAINDTNGNITPWQNTDDGPDSETV